jgi:hypothetical protein
MAFTACRRISATFPILFRRLDVAAFEAALARWIASRLCDEETAVIALDGKTLGGIVPVRGRIITGDALFCQRDLCQQIIDRGGDYVFAVKDNQPSLEIDIHAGLSWEDEKRRQVALFFPDVEPVGPPPGSTATAVDKGHGRLERRTLRRTTILTKTQQWAGLKQGFELTLP